MKQFISTLLILLAINLAGMSTAQAAIKIYVKNCAGMRVSVGTFNAKDSVQSVHYEVNEFIIGEGSSLKCKGQGKGFCRVRLRAINNCEDEDGFTTKVDKNKWIKITSCESDGYEKNLSSEPSCD